jgi:hypothetical protein
MTTLPALALALAVLAPGCGSSDKDDDACSLDDADGVTGGNVSFEVTVDDDGFVPAILTSQDSANVTLTLRNTGTRPHAFVIDCMPTPNANGCPMTSCFPDTASISAVAPDSLATTTFVVPRVEGIHYYHSDEPGDTDGPCAAGARGCGQYIVK